MASIHRRKSGSFEISVSLGRDPLGKPIRRFTTFAPDASWSAHKAQKEAQHAACLFEEQCRKQAKADTKQTLANFSERWMREYAQPRLSRSTVERYRDLLVRINEAMGHMMLDQLSGDMLRAFYANLAEDGIRRDYRYLPQKELNTLIRKKYATQVKFAEVTGLGIKTIYKAVKGGMMAYESARRIAEALHIPMKRLFVRIGKDHLSAKTIREHHTLLSSMLNKAIQWGLLHDNVCRKVESPHFKKTDMVYLDEEDVKLLLEHLQKEPLPFHAAIRLLLDTGMRRGELCGLEWGDVDWEQRLVRIVKARSYVQGEGVKKSGVKTDSSMRTISVAESTLRLLGEYRDQLGETGKDVPVFMGRAGKPMHPDTLTCKWREFMLAHTDIPYISLHGLRHTSAMLLLLHDVDIVTISRRLGHKRIEHTMNLYMHFCPQLDQRAAQIMDRVAMGA